jgi:hypothetical protein
MNPLADFYRARDRRNPAGRAVPALCSPPRPPRGLVLRASADEPLFGDVAATELLPQRRYEREQQLI